MGDPLVYDIEKSAADLNIPMETYVTMYWSRCMELFAARAEENREIDPLQETFDALSAFWDAGGRQPPLDQSYVLKLVKFGNVTAKGFAQSRLKHAKYARVARAVTLNFRLVNDSQLKLADRIIFSLAWKWSHLNHKRQVTTEPFDPQKYRRFTGFRASTIRTSLEKLRSLRYIDRNHRPLFKGNPRGQTKRELLNGMKYLGYRRLEWLNAGNVKSSIAHQIVEGNKGRQNTPAWLSRALGISRSTACRILKKFRGTDETNAEPMNCNEEQLRHEKGTDEARRGTNEA